MLVTRTPAKLMLVLALAAVTAAGMWWLRSGDSDSRRPVYVALGASDAVGIGAQQPGREGWVARLHAQLPDDPQLVNLGMNGARISDVLTMQAPVAIDAGPRWVSLWPGINDLRDDLPRETFARQLDETLAQLATVDGVTVVLLTIPDLRHLPDYAEEEPRLLDSTVRAWNDVITEAGLRHGALVVDLYAGAPELALNPDYVSADGFHPSSDGYRRIAEMVVENLEEHHALVSR